MVFNQDNILILDRLMSMIEMISFLNQNLLPELYPAKH